MVQFKILSGRNAGTTHSYRQFPLSIGRSASAGLQLQDAGVWDTHLKLDLDATGSFTLLLQPDAIATVNGQPFASIALKNGDLIELGSVKIQFWLGETKQHRLRPREAVTWVIIFLLTAAQAALIFWLLN